MTKVVLIDTTWLLILDNVDDFKVLNSFWPDLQHGSVLITSRDSSPELESVRPFVEVVALMPFSPDEGEELIKKRLTGKISGAFDDNSAAKLAKFLGYFPLYMAQAASFIESSRYTLSRFYELSPELADDELQDWHTDGLWYPSSVARALESHITKLDSQLKTVLKTMAFFDPDRIPERLLISRDKQVRALSTPFQCQSALVNLERHSFIHFDIVGINGAEKNINMHRLVRDAALRLDTNTQEAFDNAVHLLRQSFPLQGLARDHMVEDWGKCEEFQPHVLALHKRYMELRTRQSLQASNEFLELVYSCSWCVPYTERVQSPNY